MGGVVAGVSEKIAAWCRYGRRRDVHRSILSVCPGPIFFCNSIFYVLIVVLLKGMDETFLLSEDEHITPNIDGVMAL